MPKRTHAFIDGFNLYHAIMGRDKNSVRALSKYRWLNLNALVSRYLDKDDVLESVQYFTAYTNWDSQKIGRHKTYVRALKSVGVQVVLGKFYEVEKRCRICGADYFTWEEKQSDVNLATQVVHRASSYEKAIIITGDSDICPAIRTVKETYPAKQLVVIIPPGRPAEELKQTADAHHSITEEGLKNSQFAGVLTDARGLFTLPTGWSS